MRLHFKLSVIGMAWMWEKLFIPVNVLPCSNAILLAIMSLFCYDFHPTPCLFMQVKTCPCTSGQHFWDPVRVPPQRVNKTLLECHHSVVGWSGGHISCCGGPTWPTSDDPLWCFHTSQGVRGPSCCQIAGRYRLLQRRNHCSNGDAPLHTSPLHV